MPQGRTTLALAALLSPSGKAAARFAVASCPVAQFAFARGKPHITSGTVINWPLYSLPPLSGGITRVRAPLRYTIARPLYSQLRNQTPPESSESPAFLTSCVLLAASLSFSHTAPQTIHTCITTPTLSLVWSYVLLTPAINCQQLRHAELTLCSHLSSHFPTQDRYLLSLYSNALT